MKHNRQLNKKRLAMIGFIIGIVFFMFRTSFDEDSSWNVTERDLDILYAELLYSEEKLASGKYYFNVNIVDDPNVENSYKDAEQYVVEVTKDAFYDYNAGSVLKGYKDQQGKLVLVGVSVEQPYDISAH